MRPSSSSFRPSSALYWKSVSLSSPDISAAAGLAVASLLGLKSDQIFPNTGILATLVASAVMCNANLVPAAHSLYDLAWTTFLPASLALLMISEAGTKQTGPNRSEGAATATVRRVAMPFVVGSIGSFLGCFASFLVCRQRPHLWLNPLDACLAGGCLCASYIGGSVNFFASAKILGDANTSLLSALAASDLIVMAIYFTLMTASLQFTKLRSLFLTEGEVQIPEDTNGEKVSSSTTTAVSPAWKSGALVLVSGLSLCIVKIANKIEKWLAPVVPGMACAVIALLTTFLCRCLDGNNHFNRLWDTMKEVATPVSEICFQLLFAAIGTSANIGQALMNGPACLWFSAFALLWHVVVVIVGSLPFRRRLYWEDVLVASNAAIGGPGTAAAFASKLHIKGITIAATVWGVVGYAIGTTLGVFTARLMHMLVPKL